MVQRDRRILRTQQEKEKACLSAPNLRCRSIPRGADTTCVKQAAPALRKPAVGTTPLLSEASLRRSTMAQLVCERQRAARHNDMPTLNRLRTQEGSSAFQRRIRLLRYADEQRRANGITHGIHTNGAISATPAEIATQTEGAEASASVWTRTMLAGDEQSLDHLAEADLAYLEMVRTKAGFHLQSAGALTTSDAEQALAESWQKLILLRLESQKMQLRQKASPMAPQDMKRVELQLMNETKRIANELQQQLQQLTGQGHDDGSPDPPQLPAVASDSLPHAAEQLNGVNVVPALLDERSGTPISEVASSQPPLIGQQTSDTNSQLEVREAWQRWSEWDSVERPRPSRRGVARSASARVGILEPRNRKSSHRSAALNSTAVKGATSMQRERAGKLRPKKVSREAQKKQRASRQRRPLSAPPRAHASTAAVPGGTFAPSKSALCNLISRVEVELRREDQTLSKLEPRLRMLCDAGTKAAFRPASEAQLQRLCAALANSQTWLNTLQAQVDTLQSRAALEKTEQPSAPLPSEAKLRKTPSLSRTHLALPVHSAKQRSHGDKSQLTRARAGSSPRSVDWSAPSPAAPAVRETLGSLASTFLADESPCRMFVAGCADSLEVDSSPLIPPSREFLLREHVDLLSGSEAEAEAVELLEMDAEANEEEVLELLNSPVKMRVAQIEDSLRAGETSKLMQQG